MSDHFSQLQPQHFPASARTRREGAGTSEREAKEKTFLFTMPRPDVDLLEEQIERLRGGGTLTESEVHILCEKVSLSMRRGSRLSLDQPRTAGRLTLDFERCLVSHPFVRLSPSCSLPSFTGKGNLTGRK